MAKIDELPLREAVETLSSRPSAFITDIDGTISRIAPTPDEAGVTRRCRDLLRDLAARVDLLAAVSGRAAADARATVGLREMVYVGNHGLEVWQAGEATALPEAAAFAADIAAALREVADDVQKIQGVLCEDKGLTASIHYRLAADPGEARERIIAALQRSPAARRLRWTEGRMVVELRPPITANKGTAVEMLIRRYALRGAVYVGDDVTDVDAFRALQRAGRATGVRTLAIGVVAAETPATVSQHADVTLVGVAGVESLLAALCENLPPLGPADRRTAGRATR